MVMLVMVMLWLSLLWPLSRPYHCSTDLLVKESARAGRLNCFTSHFPLTGITSNSGNNSSSYNSTVSALLQAQTFAFFAANLLDKMDPRWAGNWANESQMCISISNSSNGSNSDKILSYCLLTYRWDENERVLNATERNWRQFRCTIALMSCGTSFF